MDSGASRTYTNDPRVFIPESTEKFEDHISKTAGGQFLRSKLKGNTKELQNVIFIPEIDSNLISVGQLCDDIDARVIFDANKVEVHHYGDVVMVGARNRSSGLYEIGFGLDRAYHVAGGGDGGDGAKMAAEEIICERFIDLHRKLGHLAFSKIKELITKGYLSKDKYKELLKVPNDVICRTCVMSKMASKPHKSSTRSYPNDRIGSHFSSDVCGPFPVQTPSGALYFITFVDRFSRFSFLYLMNRKSDAPLKFREFLGEVGTRLPPGHEVKILRTDKGGEYTSGEFEALLVANKIFHELTTPFSPESNGIAERLNRKLIEMVRCFLHESGLPRTYWGEGVKYANDLLNYWPHSHNENNVSPFELWTEGEKPPLESLFVWGCPTFMLIPHERRGDPKLGDVAISGVAIGLSACRRAVRVLDRGSGKVYESRDVKFDTRAYKKRLMECNDAVVRGDTGVAWRDNVIDVGADEERWVPPSAGMPIVALPAPIVAPTAPAATVVAPPPVVRIDAAAPAAAIIPHEEAKEIGVALPPVPRRSARPHVPAMPSQIQRTQEAEHYRRLERRFGSSVNNLLSEAQARCLMNVSNIEGNILDNFLMELTTIVENDPLTYYEAVNHPEHGEEWIEAIRSEVYNLARRETWEFAILPSNRKALSYKWVFKTKRDSSGAVSRRKARLAIKGFEQVYGVDYQETYAPTVHHTTLRLALALSALLGPSVVIDHWDVVGAYLWANVDAEIYMEIPLGVEDVPDGVDCVRLRKALYGLKQAGRLWYETLDNALLDECGMVRTECDECLFVWYGDNGEMVWILVWVDDILCITNYLPKLRSIQERLNTLFELQVAWGAEYGGRY